MIVLERLDRLISIEIEMIIVLVAFLDHVRELGRRPVEAERAAHRARQHVAVARVMMMMETHQFVQHHRYLVGLRVAVVVGLENFSPLGSRLLALLLLLLMMMVVVDVVVGRRVLLTLVNALGT